MTTDPQIDKITRVGSREYRIEQLHSGKVVGRQTAVVSKDGMLLTIKKARTFAEMPHPADLDCGVPDQDCAVVQWTPAMPTRCSRIGF